MTSLVVCLVRFKYIHLLWLIVNFYSVMGNETKNVTTTGTPNHPTDDANSCHDCCKSFNIRMSAYADPSENRIKLYFEPTEVKFKDCFKYFDIFLEKQGKIVDYVKLSYLSDANKPASYKFTNVTCGLYEIAVIPCYTDWECSPLRILYPKAINMSSNDCFNAINLPSRKLMPGESIKMKIIIPVAVVSIILICAVGGIYYYSVRFKSNEGKKKGGQHSLESKNDKIVDEAVQIAEKRINVYIFHYYDKNDIIKRRVEVLRDFLVQSSYYSSIKVIEGELLNILNNPNDWLNKALEKQDEDGSIIKIIIIDSKEDNEEEEYGTENLIYTQVIETLDNDKYRCRTGYDTLFVVRLNGTQAFSKRIANFVRGQRYRIPDHLIDLCLNLFSGSEFDISGVEKNLKELLMQHPVRFLGMVQDV